MQSCGTTTNLLNKSDSHLHDHSRYLRVYIKKREHQDYFISATCSTSESLFASSLDGNSATFYAAFSKVVKCRRAQTIVIIHNSPFLFNWYFPAEIELRNMADVIKYVPLRKYLDFKGTGSTCGMSCQIQSHVDLVNLFYPNLYCDLFAVPQVNSSDFEIFMSWKGEKYPWDRTDFVSLGLKFSFPSAHWAEEKAPSPWIARRA